MKALSMNFGKILGFAFGCYWAAQHNGVYEAAHAVIYLGLPTLIGHYAADLPWRAHKAAEGARKCSQR